MENVVCCTLSISVILVVSVIDLVNLEEDTVDYFTKKQSLS